MGLLYGLGIWVCCMDLVDGFAVWVSCTGQLVLLHGSAWSVVWVCCILGDKFGEYYGRS